MFDIEAFLEAYQSLPMLWNRSCPEYKNRSKRDEAELCLLPYSGVSNVKEMRKRIRSLRGTYNQEVAKIKKCMAMGESARYKPKLKWFGLAHSFLQKTEDAISVGNYPGHTDEEIMDHTTDSYEDMSESPILNPQVYNEKLSNKSSGVKTVTLESTNTKKDSIELPTETSLDPFKVLATNPLLESTKELLPDKSIAQPNTSKLRLSSPITFSRNDARELTFQKSDKLLNSQFPTSSLTKTIPTESVLQKPVECLNTSTANLFSMTKSIKNVGKKSRLDKSVEFLNTPATGSISEFRDFGNHIATQLERLPLREALRLQETFQSMITSARLRNLADDTINNANPENFSEDTVERDFGLESSVDETKKYMLYFPEEENICTIKVEDTSSETPKNMKHKAKESLNEVRKYLGRCDVSDKVFKPFQDALVLLENGIDRSMYINKIQAKITDYIKNT